MSGQKFISEAPGSGGEPALLQEAAGTPGRSRVMATGCRFFWGRGTENLPRGRFAAARWQKGVCLRRGRAS